MGGKKTTTEIGKSKIFILLQCGASRSGCPLGAYEDYPHFEGGQAQLLNRRSRAPVLRE